MLDWAILIGGIVGFVVILWRGYRWLRQEPEPEETAVVLPIEMRYAYEERRDVTPDIVHMAMADEIAERVHEHERACERTERAAALLQAVTMGHKPDEDEIKSLYEYHCGHDVSTALALGASRSRNHNSTCPMF